MSKSKSLLSVLIIVVFLFALYGKRLLQNFVVINFESPLINLLYSYSWWLLPIAITVGVLYGFKNVLKELCLNQNLWTGFAFSLIVVSPMLISSAVVGELTPNLDILNLLKKTLFAGFMEELLFRGFLFGLLFRKFGWGFIPASLLGATIFAISHLYQGSTTSELIGVFIATFIGSAWFAWLFIEWKENLWIPIFLHIFMNLSWTLFNVSDNAMGGTYTNVFRIITIVLTVIATIQFNKRKDRFRINAKNLFINNMKA